MKLKQLIIGCVLVFLLLNMAAQAEWIAQDNYSTENLNGVSFVNDSTGWIVGNNGIILKTTDGGHNWSQVNHQFIIDFEKVCFVNDSSGWIVGSHGYILHSNNGGDNWIKQEVNMPQTSLFSVCFVNDSTGWIVGRYGTILKTSNQGENWIHQISNTTNLLWSVFFIDDTTGWITGDYSTILHTTDGGTNWTKQNIELNDGLKSVHFVDPQNGWIVGGWVGGLILDTQSEGKIWQEYANDIPHNLYSVFFDNLNNGWAAGDSGAIYCTLDGGLNWSLEESPTGNTLKSVFFLNDSLGWVVGEEGVILKYQKSENTNIIDYHSFLADHIHKPELRQNYPNPFNSSTTFQFLLHTESNVTLKVFNLLGEEIATLLNEHQMQGEHRITWDAKNMGSGVYFFQLKTGQYIQTKKLILQE